MTEPLLSCPVPETPGRVPWRPPGYIKIPRGILARGGRDLRKGAPGRRISEAQQNSKLRPTFSLSLSPMREKP